MYKYKLFQTNKFKKDLKKVIKRQSFNQKEYDFVVDTLLKGEALPVKYCNHMLEPKSDRAL